MQQLVHGHVGPPAREEAQSGEEQTPRAAVQAAVETAEGIREGDEQRFEQSPAHRWESDDTLAELKKGVNENAS